MSTPDSLSSREKKTLRDRRAQIARRARQAAHIKTLEEQIEHCHREHKTQIRHEEEIASLRAALNLVTQECEELRRRQAAAVQLLVPGCQNHQILETRKNGSSFKRDPQNQGHANADDESSADNWSLVPIHNEPDEFVLGIAPWLLCPAVIEPLPDVPSASELLSGSSTNALANAIYIALTYAYTTKVADSERLAMGWILYVLSKWMLHPTAERFARLPHFLRPTPLQRSCPHSPLIDFMMWPKLRDNMITVYCRSKDEFTTVLWAIAPGIKLLWPTDAALLEPNPDNPSEVVMRPEFLDTFMQLENWTMTADFVNSFPEIAAGIDWRAAIGENETSNTERLYAL